MVFQTLLCFRWYIGRVSNISFGWYWRIHGMSGHRGLPQIWQIWQTKIKKDNCAIHEQKKLQKIFSNNTKIFASETLMPINESISCNFHKLGAIGSFMAISPGMVWGSNARKELDLWRFSTWTNFTSSFVTLILVMQMEDDYIFLEASHDSTQSSN